MAVALITGASRGIGAHLTRALADAGWQVAALARDVDKLQKVAAEIGTTATQDPAVIPIRCDVTDAEDVEAAVGEAVRTSGQVDLLVNNAGSNHREAALWEVEPQEWWQVLTTNVKGPYLLTRAVVPHMIAAGGGRV